jgi:hypothetical protein
MILKQKNMTLVKRPGDINGMQFIVEECEVSTSRIQRISSTTLKLSMSKDCCIYLFDFSAQINIDLCKRCHIFIGPCEGR